MATSQQNSASHLTSALLNTLSNPLVIMMLSVKQWFASSSFVANHLFQLLEECFKIQILIPLQLLILPQLLLIQQMKHQSM